MVSAPTSAQIAAPAFSLNQVVQYRIANQQVTQQQSTVDKEIAAFRQRKLDRAAATNERLSRLWAENPKNWELNRQPDNSGMRGYKWIHNRYGNNGKWYGVFESNLGHRVKLWDIGMGEWAEDKRQLGVSCPSCNKGFTAVIPGQITCPNCKFVSQR